MVRCEWTPEGIEVQCRAGCGKLYVIKGVTEAQFNAWKSGTLIQKAMPQVEKDERELLISGTCGKCWEEMFKFDEGDGDDEPEDLTHYNAERDDQRDEFDGGPDNIKDERI